MTYSEAFELGRKAYDAEEPETANPYDRDADRYNYDQWAEGWEYEWGNWFGERAEA